MLYIILIKKNGGYMTIIEYINWFKVNWPKTGLIVSIFLIVYLAVIVLPKSLLLFALLLSAPLYMLHEFDEYVFPGGFAQFMNKNIYKLDPEMECLTVTPYSGSILLQYGPLSLCSVFGQYSILVRRSLYATFLYFKL